MEILSPYERALQICHNIVGLSLTMLLDLVPKPNFEFGYQQEMLYILLAVGCRSVGILTGLIPRDTIGLTSVNCYPLPRPIDGLLSTP